ncbi:predicted transcriptional regulator of the myo-inositol catabolic operon [Vibrio astriarenae]|nr:predicted transcriptional regulator of the myo-inositol catabolic operon [Vibrio sp. C7]
MLVAVETMATIAKQANVPLSTLSRFSNAMGFDGFSSMQALFREQYLNRPRDYKERVRKAREMEDVLKMRRRRSSKTSGMQILKRSSNCNCRFHLRNWSVQWPLWIKPRLSTFKVHVALTLSHFICGMP